MQGRANSFDALRLIGALLVIAGHSYALTNSAAPRLAGIEIHGIGVRLFFAISGFLITASYQRDPSFARFAMRRVSRIMPALIAVVLLTVAALAFITTADAGTYARGAGLYVIRNMVLLPYHALPGVFEHNPLSAVNGSLWTLPVEVFMYALVPLIARAFRIVLLGLALLLLAEPITFEVFGFGLAGASTLIPYFLLGAFAQLVRLKVHALIAAASAISLLVATAWPIPEIVIAIPFALLVLYVGSTRWLRHWPVDISYGTYLLAFPIQQLLIVAHPPIAPLWLALSTALIVAPLALLSWRYIEAPALNMARRLTHG